jgi:hypothetical protein
MLGPHRLIAQIALYGLFAVFIGYFSNAPTWSRFGPDQALIKLSFSHPGKRKGECRWLTPDEIAELAPNMRRTRDCPRERLPVTVELFLDGELLHRETLPPTGIWNDGASSIYRRFPVMAGKHHLVVRLRDSARTSGYDYQRVANIDLAPARNFVIDFSTEIGDFVLR